MSIAEAPKPMNYGDTKQLRRYNRQVNKLLKKDLEVKLIEVGREMLSNRHLVLGGLALATLALEAQMQNSTPPPAKITLPNGEQRRVQRHVWGANEEIRLTWKDPARPGDTFSGTFTLPAVQRPDLVGSGLPFITAIQAIRIGLILGLLPSEVFDLVAKGGASVSGLLGGLIRR